MTCHGSDFFPLHVKILGNSLFNHSPPVLKKKSWNLLICNQLYSLGQVSVHNYFPDKFIPHSVVSTVTVFGKRFFHCRSPFPFLLPHFMVQSRWHITILAQICPTADLPSPPCCHTSWYSRDGTSQYWHKYAPSECSHHPVLNIVFSVWQRTLPPPDLHLPLIFHTSWVQSGWHITVLPQLCSTWILTWC